MLSNTTAPEEFLQMLTAVTEANLSSEKFGVSELAKKMGISRTSLHRKLKQITQKSASRFICEIRLKKAFQLLQQNAGSVSEIAYEVGFASSTYFSKCFHDFYGISPGEVKNGKTAFPADNKEKVQKTKPAKPFLILLLFMMVLFFAGGAIYKTHQQHNHSKLLMILTPESDGSNTEIIPVISGLQHEIRNKLHEINGLDVVSESTSLSYSKSGFTIKKIARTGIDYILLFQPIFMNEKITVYVELTDTHNNKVLISEPYKLSEFSDDMYRAIEELTVSLVSGIKDEILPAENQEHLTSTE